MRRSSASVPVESATRLPVSCSRLATKALRRLGRFEGQERPADYVVTDVIEATADRRFAVVFLEQHWAGLPLHGARRSVILGRRTAWVTGSHRMIRSSSARWPVVSAEDAVVVAGRAVGLKPPKQSVSAESRGLSADRYTRIRLRNVSRPVTARLAIVGAGAARLCWVVGLTIERRQTLEAYELVVDAVTGAVISKRTVSNNAAACIRVDSAAGGPAPNDPPYRLPFNSAWLDLATRTVRCVNGVNTAIPLPGQQGTDYCGATTPFHLAIVNAFTLASAGLEILRPLGGKPASVVRLTMLDASTSDVSRVARAIPSNSETLDPELRFQARKAVSRHAGSDPAVVLHELAHLILYAGVGGGQVDAPFEPTGESAAVNEGLADFIGLVLWNALRRTLTTAPPAWNVGTWVFDKNGRDYNEFLTGANPPVYPSGNTPHVQGQVLCGALVRAWNQIATADGPATADTVLLGAVCRSLALLPHDDDRPRFCCAAKALGLTVPTKYQVRVAAELDAREIPKTCKHIQEA